MEQLLIFVGLLASPFVLYYLYKLNRFYLNSEIKNNGLLYSWESSNLASSANPPSKSYINGHKWLSVDEFKSESLKNKNSKNPVFSSNFSFFEDNLKELELPNFLKNKAEKEKFYVDGDMTSKTVAVLGSAGGGKTQWILNFMLQSQWYSKAIFFSKKGDFDGIFYRSDTIDILVNNKAKLASIHDILSEEIQYIGVFIDSIINDKMGEENDYFTTSSRTEIKEVLQDIFIAAYSNKKMSTKEKWEMLITEYERRYTEAMEGEQKSKRDVYATIKQVFEVFYFMAWRIIKTDATTFTAKDFFNNPKENNRLFLNATDPSEEGPLAATFAVLAKYQLALPNDWISKPVAWVQDEYLSLSRIVGEEILDEMRQVGRSKKISGILGTQNIPTDNEKTQKMLTNIQYIVCFSGTDPKTLELVSKIAGKVEYINYSKSISKAKSGDSVSYSEQKVQENVITNYHMNILQKEGFSHIFLGLKEKFLFKGTNPYVDEKKLSRDYINTTEQVNLVDFYIWMKERRDNLKTTSKAAASILESIVDSKSLE